MGGMHFLGLILVWALVVGEGHSQQISYQEENQALAGSPSQPPTPQSQQEQQQSPPAERRLSLEDFFMNRPQQQQQQPAAEQQQLVQQQLPLPQFQVQQSDPNSILLTRDRQFPSQNGGLVSRLLMLRRMLRLRRWARRLSFIPRLVRLGVQSSSLRQAASEPQPVILANNRIGRSYNNEPYDPRDYVFGNKGFSYNNTSSSQESYNTKDQPKQDANTYSREADPYYDTVNDLPYDLYDNKNSNNYGTDDSSYENQNKYKDTPSYNNNDDRQLPSYEVAKNLQQKLMQNMQQQYSNYPQSNQNFDYGSQQNEIVKGNVYPQNTQQDSYKPGNQIHHNTNQQDAVENNNGQNQKLQENSNQYAKPAESNGYEGLTDQQKLQRLREQQLQIEREQQLLQLLREQQILIERERQLQLQQQGLHQQQNQNQQVGNLYQQQNQNQQVGNLYQQQNQNQQVGNLYQQQNQQEGNLYQQQNQQGGNLYQQQNQHSQIESEAPNSNYQSHTYSQPQQNSYEQTGQNSYEKPLLADANNVRSGTRIGSGGNIIGVGVNVGIKPPAVDISVTKPGSPVIKPLPPLVNPILPKPIPAPAVAEQLVPIGFLPKPILNLNGRLFFGAEVGKDVKVGR